MKTLLWLKKESRAETTLRGISKKLKSLDKYTDLDNPEAVKEYIADKKVSNTYKRMLAIAYNHYVVVNCLKWSKPVYYREENAIRVPTNENVERLIAYAGPKYSTIISVMKDTGARPCELERVRLTDVDFNQGIIYLPSRKGSRGRPRIKPIRSKVPPKMKRITDYM